MKIKIKITFILLMISCLSSCLYVPVKTNRNFNELKKGIETNLPPGTQKSCVEEYFNYHKIKYTFVGKDSGASSNTFFADIYQAVSIIGGFKEYIEIIVRLDKDDKVSIVEIRKAYTGY